jgi:hypothetical protein
MIELKRVLWTPREREKETRGKGCQFDCQLVRIKLQRVEKRSGYRSLKRRGAPCLLGRYIFLSSRARAVFITLKRMVTQVQGSA